MHIAISGSSGLVGTALVAALRARGDSVSPMVRRAPKDHEIGWVPDAGVLDPAPLRGVDAIVNLAGPGIGDRRWTDDYKRELHDARVKATTLIATTMASVADGPGTLVSASGVNFYGEDSEASFDESSPAGDGFLADLCVDWEASTAPAADAGKRVVMLRTGMVLSAHGGALARMLPLFRLGLGGRFGSGHQWQSWISVDDHVAAIIHLLDGALSGPVNSTAPNPTTNREFTKTLARVLARPAVIPVPKFAPALLFGRELVDTLLYHGQRVLPRVLEADGFEFRHPTLEGALRSVLGRSSGADPD